MARRRRNSLIKIASRLPWWVSLLIVLGNWLILYPIANSQPYVPKDLHQIGQSVAGLLGAVRFACGIRSRCNWLFGC